MPNEPRDTAREIARQCVGVRVRMLGRMVSRHFDDALRPHGVKLAQMNLLTAIALRGPVQPSEVARRLAIEKSTLSRNLKLLQENGWIRTVQGESGNSHLLELTAAGKRLYQRAAPTWQTAHDELTELMGDREVRAIHRATERVLDAEQTTE